MEKKKKKRRCGCGEREQLQFPEDKKQLHSFPDVILSGRKAWLHSCSPADPRDGPSCPLCCVALTWHRFGTGALVPGNWGRRMPNGGGKGRMSFWKMWLWLSPGKGKGDVANITSFIGSIFSHKDSMLDDFPCLINKATQLLLGTRSSDCDKLFNWQNLLMLNCFFISLVKLEITILACPTILETWFVYLIGPLTHSHWKREITQILKEVFLSSSLLRCWR